TARATAPSTSCRSRRRILRGRGRGKRASSYVLLVRGSEELACEVESEIQAVRVAAAGELLERRALSVREREVEDVAADAHLQAESVLGIADHVPAEARRHFSRQVQGRT